MSKHTKLTFKEQITGFPVKQMFIICIIRFSEPLAFTSLFPYVYFMIRDFKIAKEEKDISKYSGYLASSFAFCQFLFCVKWGKLSDRIGRKRVLLSGLFGTSISLILFGFSKNYYMALFARCLAGALNGNIAVLRTMIGEIATERRHQAIAFSTLPLLFNFGSVIGPLIGGSKYFTNPKPNSPYNSKDPSSISSSDINSFYHSFINKHPYALSNIIVAVFLWFSLICGILFLEETHEAYKNNRDYGIELGDWLLSRIGIKTKVRPWQLSLDREEQFEPTENLPLLVNNRSSVNSQTIDNDSDDASVEPFLSRSMSRAIVRRYSMSEENKPKYDYKNAFTPRVIQVITSNFIISLHSVTYNEFLPVYLASRLKPDKLKFPFKIEGGLGLDVSYIGTLFSSTGIMGMLIVLIIFPIIDRKLGTINGFRLSVSIFPLVYFIVPYSIFTLHEYNTIFPAWSTPAFLYTLTSLKTLASATGMPQVMLLNHRAASKEHRAYVNSSTMSMLALARCTGPIAFGYLMSLGDKYSIGWLMWWVMGLLALIGTIQSYWMEDYEDEEDEEEETASDDDVLQTDFSTVDVEDDTQSSIG